MNLNDDRIGCNGLVIFDGLCGVCSTLIGRREIFFKRHGFTIAPLQEEWAQEITGLPVDTLQQSIHLYTRNGQVYRGLEFIQRLAEEVWWLAPLRVMLMIPPIYWLCKRLYSFFAKRRMLISTVCKLSPTDE